MKKLIKIFLWSAVIFIVLVVAASLLLPRYINSELLKGRIESTISREIGGDATFRKIDLSILPRPYAVIHDGKIETGRARGSLQSLSIYPSLLSLFVDKWQASKVIVSNPEINVTLPSKNGVEQTAEASPGTAASEISSFLASLTSAAPNLDVEIKKGRLALVRDSRNKYIFTDIDSTVSFPPRGQKHMKAEIEIAGLEFHVFHNDNEVTAKASDMAGSLQYESGNATFSVSEITFEYPKLVLAGELGLDGESLMLDLLLEGKEMDVQSTREAALALGGEIPDIREIFNIVKGGHIPSIAFTSSAKSFEDLVNTENFVIKGNMTEGEIFIPGVELDLAKVHGDVAIEKGILEGKNLEAQMGNSHGQKGALTVGLEEKDDRFHLDMMLQADLAELQPLLMRISKNETLEEELSLVDNVTGTASGRLVLGESLNSVKARVEASAVDLSARYKRVPYPIEFSTDNFIYDESGIDVKNLEGTTGGSSFSGLGFHIDFDKKPILKISSGQALINLDEMYPWFSKLTDLPPESHLLSPLSVKNINLAWNRGETTLLNGSVSLQNGPDISFDIARSNEEMNIKKLTVRDETSDAEMGLNLKGNQVDMKFKGNLTGSTVNTFMSDNDFLKGWVRGDFQVHLHKDRPLNSSVQGRLEGKDINVPLESKEPLHISDISLEGLKKSLEVVAKAITIGENRVGLTGTIHGLVDVFEFDSQMTADTLAWEKLHDAFDTDQKNEERNVFYELPLQGTIRLSSQTLTYDKYALKPFHADIKILPDTIDLTITDAALCGISSAGGLTFSPQDVTMVFQLYTTDQDMDPAIACLWGMEKHKTGRFNLNAKVGGKGKQEELFDSLTGNLDFSAKDGRIYKGGVLSKILAFINIIEVFRGQVPDLGKEGFAYNSITANGELKGTTLTLNEAVIDGTTMNLVGHGDIHLNDNTVDLDIIASPLKTVDSIVEKIPVINDITEGTLISIPVKATGDLSDPDVTYLSPATVGSRLLGLVKNILKAPFKLIEPILPGTNKNNTETPGGKTENNE